MITTGRPLQRNGHRGLVCIAATFFFACTALSGQQTSPSASEKTRPSREAARQATTQIPQTRSEREQQIVNDNAKLLKLVTDLKTEIDKTTLDTLSIAVIRKADQIEKLAHSVREKMKVTVDTAK